MKKSTVLRLAMKHANAHLSLNNVRNYWTVVSLVVKAQDSSALTPLKDAVRRRDFVSCLAITESLSSTLYDDHHEHFVMTQLHSLFKKYPYPGTEELFHPEAQALLKFVESEQRCRRYNQLLRGRRKYSRYPVHAPDFEAMRRWIRYVIGDAPDLAKIWALGGFGPGASIGVHGNATNPGRKLSAEDWSVTPSAAHYFQAACCANLFLARVIMPNKGGYIAFDGATDARDSVWSKMKFVDYNKITFVPKTVKTFRSIAVEPLGNGIVQKGADNYLRGRLLRVGLDLRDQSANQRFAREGSLDESPAGFVTLDLSSASDSISIELCREVLPPAWFDFLNACRSKYYRTYAVDESIRYEKFCSMGNGFCFPLQTLLFAAICASVHAGQPGKDFLVYGDDIIVRGRYAADVTIALYRCGFRLNRSKSHVSGPFRESCGADWHRGVDVRPYNLDDAFDSIQNVYKFLNLTARKPLWETFFAPARNFVLGLLPSSLRLYRPFQGPADSGLDSTDEFLSSPSVRYLGNGLWSWTELAVRPVLDPVVEENESLREPLEWYEAHNSREGMSCYTLRNTIAHTTFVVKRGGGAWSNWLPQNPTW